MMNKNKILCKNTLKGYNSRGTEVLELFYADKWYDIVLENGMFIFIADENNTWQMFRISLNNDFHYYIYDWFYTPAESRQKQIDSVIYE